MNGISTKESSEPRQPTRSCIFCRGRARKEALLRFVAGPNGVVWDRQQKLPGRGAYVHQQYGCWSKMPELKNWRRAFRLDAGEMDRLHREGLLKVMEEVRSLIKGLDRRGETRGSGVSRGKVRL